MILIKKGLTILYIFIIVLVITGCDTSIETNGSLRISITVQPAHEGADSCSGLPLSFHIYGSGPNNRSFEKIEQNTIVMISDLSPGIWNITVEAIDPEGSVIDKSSEKVIIYPGKITHIDIEVLVLPEPTPEPTLLPTSMSTPITTPEPTEATVEPTPEQLTPLPTEETTGEPTTVLTEPPTEVPTEAPTPQPTSLPTDEPTVPPTTVPTSPPTETPTSAPTSVPTGVPTTHPTALPTATPVHYAVIYYVADTDCSDDQYTQGYIKVQNALNEVKEQFDVDFDLINLGRIWDAPDSDDTSTVLQDLYSDFYSYRSVNEYVVGYTPVMGNNGVAYVNGHHCVVAWRPSGLISWDHEETKLTAHELTHNWGVAAEGHVDSLLPSTEVCIMNYWHLALMDSDNILWCDGCKSIVQNTMNRWPVR
jgi:hypothetical protein